MKNERESNGRVAADYVEATRRVYHAAGEASFIDLPIVPVQ
jgi:hypothetical protein